MFVISLLIIFFISLGLSLLSLWKELKKTEQQKASEVKKSLEKGRVLFYSPSSSSSED